MVRVLLTPEADDDLKDIRAYSMEQWGSDQADQYETLLFSKLALLEQNPQLGVSPPGMGPGVRVLRIEQHNALYRVESDRILVLRVVHVRRPLPTLE